MGQRILKNCHILSKVAKIQPFESKNILGRTSDLTTNQVTNVTIMADYMFVCVLQLLFSQTE